MRCVMPHVNLEVRSNGTFGPCCLNYHVYRDEDGRPFNIATDNVDVVWNSPARARYAELLDSAPLDDCAQCWAIESGGGHSKRMGENQTRSSHPAGHLSGLDIKFSNVCNLRCVICGPYNSSQWYNDWKMLKGREFDNTLYKWINDDEIVSDLMDTALSCRIIEFYGGEPLLIRQHVELLRRCVESKRSCDQEIRLNTNGTVDITDEHINLYSRFSKVTINWSIDAADVTAFEYQRYPADHSTVMDNMRRFMRAAPANIHCNITCTVSAMNVLYLDGMMDLARELGVAGLHLNVLTDPNSLSYHRVPRHAVVDHLVSCDQRGVPFNGPSVSDLLAMTYVDKPSSHLIDYLDRLDHSRGTSWRSSLTRLAACI